MELTCLILEVPEGYIGIVPELPGANTQGTTLEEVRENLKEAVGMILAANREAVERSLEHEHFQRTIREEFCFA